MDDCERTSIGKGNRSYAIRNCHVRSKAVSLRPCRKLDTKFHTLNHRDFNSIRHIDIVRVGICTDSLRNLEATLCRSHIRFNGECLRFATTTLIQPNGIKRNIRIRRRRELAESIGIVCGNHIRASFIQSPTCQACIRAAQNIERLQSRRCRNLINRISFAVLEITAVEHFISIGCANVLIIGDYILVFQERSLDTLDTRIKVKFISDNMTLRISIKVNKVVPRI